MRGQVHGVLSTLRRGRRLGLVLAAAGFPLWQPAQADSVSNFYKGKTITLVIGTSSGNDYDNRGRLLARYLGKYIPGNPSIVPENMPGAGGVRAANYLMNVAPHDGTVLHMIMSNMMTAQAVNTPGVKFDLRKFTWLGNMSDSPNVTCAWYATGVTSISQVEQRPLVVGAPTGTAGVTYVEAMNRLIGTKFKLVTGYAGGNEVNLAMERGEIEGRASNLWASWKETKPQWVTGKKINILVQVGLHRAKDLPDTPLLLELAKNDQDRQILTFLSSDTAVGRSLVVGPDVPADRIAALRRAFDETLKDPQFIADAAREKMDISEISGAEAQKIALSIVDAPRAVVDRARVFMAAGGQ
jgi:tripartite-type tricarboxylate transporter receptor subunit TctC